MTDIKTHKRTEFADELIKLVQKHGHNLGPTPECRIVRFMGIEFYTVPNEAGTYLSLKCESERGVTFEDETDERRQRAL